MSTTAKLWLIAAGSVAFFLVFKVGAILADCGPDYRQGQCGMGAFIGETFGIFGGIVLFLGLSAHVLVARARTMRRHAGEDADSHAVADAANNRAAALFQKRMDDDVRRDHGHHKQS